MQSTTEISQKGLNDMKELNIMEATVLTSPNPLTLICSKKEDGSTNLAPICFVSYLSFNPPMVGFATGKQSHTGKQVRETDKVIVTVPGESLAQTVIACGASTGAKTDKVAANNIEMMAVEGSDIQIPVDTRLAMVATLQQSVEVGDHILHICQVDKFLGDEDKKGLYSKANYIFFQGEEGLYEKCLEKGILIRDCSNYYGLKKGYYRVAVKLQEENEKLLEVLKACRKDGEKWQKRL